MVQLGIARTWDGADAAPGERAVVTLEDAGERLRIAVDAPFHGDPAPPDPPGATWALWEHEVVELFVLGPGGRYTEIELGPHGHHLVLQLEGRRKVVRRKLPLTWQPRIEGARWTGLAWLERALLPPGPHRINAYAIHGVGEARRYLAWTPVPGPAPDFHRLEAFPEVVLP